MKLQSKATNAIWANYFLNFLSTSFTQTFLKNMIFIKIFRRERAGALIFFLREERDLHPGLAVDGVLSMTTHPQKYRGFQARHRLERARPKLLDRLQRARPKLIDR
jgi:hypothetical protein